MKVKDSDFDIGFLQAQDGLIEFNILKFSLSFTQNT